MGWEQFEWLWVWWVGLVCGSQQTSRVSPGTQQAFLSQAFKLCPPDLLRRPPTAPNRTT